MVSDCEPMETDLQLFSRIKKNDKMSFEILFKQYYSNLCYFATHFTKDRDAAEDIVQEFFTYLWQRRRFITISSSFKSYVYQSIRNRSINYIKKVSSQSEFQEKFDQLTNSNYNISDFHLEYSLKKSIEKSIEQMPVKQKQIYLLSKQNGMKNSEIATQLDVSIKTVEAYITKSYKDLRHALKDFKELIISFLLFI